MPREKEKSEDWCPNYWETRKDVEKPKDNEDKQIGCSGVSLTDSQGGSLDFQHEKQTEQVYIDCHLQISIKRN